MVSVDKIESSIIAVGKEQFVYIESIIGMLYGYGVIVAYPSSSVFDKTEENAYNINLDKTLTTYKLLYDAGKTDTVTRLHEIAQCACMQLGDIWMKIDKLQKKMVEQLQILAPFPSNSNVLYNIAMRKKFLKMRSRLERYENTNKKFSSWMVDLLGQIEVQIYGCVD